MISKSSPGKRGKLSPHFDAHELACPHCGVAVVRPKLVALLERVRAASQAPLVIVSGYRCPVHNASVGGATDSMHMYGAAADIRPSIVTPLQAHALGAIGVGQHGGWAVHIDVRDGAQADWTYS